VRLTRIRAAAAACAATVAVTTVVGAAAPAAAGTEGRGGAGRFTVAVLGDTPYGDEQRAQFPALVEDINADRKVRLVLHAGDVKNGSSTCDDARLADLAALYNTFEDPFVLTPGDNEWTDCHRVSAGSYLPVERLDAVRRYFFPVAGRTLGAHPIRVRSQARDPRHRAYRENVLFERNRVVFSTVHVVGSENDLEPWSGLPGGDRPDLRVAEFEARLAANLAWIDRTFDTAQARRAAGVLVMMQAEPLATPGFQAVRDRLTQRAREFRRPVLLVHGDEHVYEVERRYAGVRNLTRLETFGATATHWLRLTVDPRARTVFSWEPRSVPAHVDGAAR